MWISPTIASSLFLPFRPKARTWEKIRFRISPFGSRGKLPQIRDRSRAQKWDCSLCRQGTLDPGRRWTRDLGKRRLETPVNDQDEDSIMPRIWSMNSSRRTASAIKRPLGWLSSRESGLDRQQAMWMEMGRQQILGLNPQYNVGPVPPYGFQIGIGPQQSQDTSMGHRQAPGTGPRQPSRMGPPQGLPTEPPQGSKRDIGHQQVTRNREHTPASSAKKRHSAERAKHIKPNRRH